MEVGGCFAREKESQRNKQKERKMEEEGNNICVSAHYLNTHNNKVLVVYMYLVEDIHIPRQFPSVQVRHSPLNGCKDIVRDEVEEYSTIHTHFLHSSTHSFTHSLGSNPYSVRSVTRWPASLITILHSPTPSLAGRPYSQPSFIHPLPHS